MWEFAVRRWQFTLLLFGLLLGVGFTTLKNIPRSEDPEFHAPVPIVVVAYPGADPADIERLIVDPIEDAINELDDIKRMDSRSLDGVGMIQVEFQWDQIRTRSTTKSCARSTAFAPTSRRHRGLEVRRTGSGLVNIVQMALVSPDASYRELDDLGRALSDDLETLPGVRRSEVLALPEPEVRIAVDLERMGRAGIALGQVEAAVRGENASIPGGSVDLGLRKFNLKTSGSYDSLDEIAGTVVASRNGRVVRLRDVAEVSWDTSEQQYIGRYNGQRAIFVTASAKDRVDVFDVREAIDGGLDRFEGTLPPNVRLERGFDQSRNVEHRLDRLGLDFAIAIGLVLLTLLPLGLRAASVVMISIPLSLAIGVARSTSPASRSTSSRSRASCSRSACWSTTRSSSSRTSRATCARATPRVEAAIAATDQIGSPSSAAPQRCCSRSCRCCSCPKAPASSSARCRRRCCSRWPRRCWFR